MMTFITIIHVIACAVLITLVLIQRGRGGGLVESFAGVESMFGTKTSSFLTRTTTIMSIVFFITCLSLAFLSVKQSESLMRSVKAPAKSAAKAEGAKAAVAEAVSPVKTETVKTEPAKAADVSKAEAPKAASAPANAEAGKPAAPAEKTK
jgi:preprotein translocase subunit SecG